jgi:bifunctional DNase/RNase
MSDFVEMKKALTFRTDRDNYGIVLSADDKYFVAFISDYRMQQLHLLTCDKHRHESSLSNDFARGILEMTEERVESVCIDSMDENIYNAVLKISGHEIKPVIPSVGLQFAMLGKGKVMIKKDFLTSRPEQVPKDAHFGKFGQKTKEREKRSLIVDNYDCWKFTTTGTKSVSGTLITPFGAAEILISSTLVPVYSNKDHKVGIYSTDEMCGKGTALKMLKKSREVFEEIKQKKEVDKKYNVETEEEFKRVETEASTIDRYDYAHIIKYMLDAKNAELVEVYLDGRISEATGGDFDTSEWDHAFISLKCNCTTETVEAPIEAAIPLGVRYLDRFMLRKQGKATDNYMG